MFLNRIGYRHSINFKKSTQCRAVNSFLFKIEIKGSTAFEFRNKLINLANTNRALIGNDQMINKHFPITGILYQGRTRKRILIKIPLRTPLISNVGIFALLSVSINETGSVFVEQRTYKYFGEQYQEGYIAFRCNGMCCAANEICGEKNSPVLIGCTYSRIYYGISNGACHFVESLYV